MHLAPSFALLLAVPSVMALVIPEEATIFAREDTAAAAVEVGTQALPCSSILLLHAAGTTQSGLGSVGTPLADAFRSGISGSTVAAIDYDTSFEYSSTLTAGARTAENVINAQITACPNQRFVLSGYSKGAMLVHRVSLSSTAKTKVIAALAFGDPNGPKGTFASQGYANIWPVTSISQVLTQCNKGDIFCDGGLSLDAHGAYATDGSVTRAVNFVKGLL